MHIHRVAVVKNESNVSTSIKSQYLVNKAPVAGEAQKHPRMIWMHEPWKQNLVHYSSDSGHCHSDISKWPDSQTSEKKQQNTRGKHMPPSHFATEQPNGSPQVSLCVADEKAPLLFFLKWSFSFLFLFTEIIRSAYSVQSNAAEKPICRVHGLHISNCELVLGNGVHPSTT